MLSSSLRYSVSLFFIIHQCTHFNDNIVFYLNFKKRNYFINLYFCTDFDDLIFRLDFCLRFDPSSLINCIHGNKKHISAWFKVKLFMTRDGQYLIMTNIHVRYRFKVGAIASYSINETSGFQIRTQPCTHAPPPSETRLVCR